MRIAAVALFFLFGNINNLSYANLLGIVETVIDEVIGVIGGGKNLIPSESEKDDLVKEIVLGTPTDLLLNVVDFICSLDASEGKLKSHYIPEINHIQFQFRTACNLYNYPVLEAENIIRNPEFDVRKKTVVLVTGWTSTVNETDLNRVGIFSKAYNCRGDYNFLAIDNFDYLQTLYTWAAVNTQLLGQYLGVGLEHLTRVVPYENIHLIGHSLGAHIVGVAGRHFTKLTGKKLKHITGIDPANPCFNEGEELEGIFRGDAEFVDIIHNTPGSVGVLAPIGDVDFYAGGLGSIKPGCDDAGCSHEITIRYYAESVYPNNVNNFMARRCSSLVALRDGLCRGEQIPMGFAVPYDVVGFYFLELNGEEPFGTNATADFQSSTSPCGKCSR